MASPRRTRPIGALYLALLKRALTGTLHEGVHDVVDPRRRPARALYRRVLEPGLAARRLRLVRLGDPEQARVGLGRPAQSETMIGLERLANVEACVRDVLERGVPGDLIETGVWRGGTTIFMRAMLEVHGDAERTVWVADSFAGLPDPHPDLYPADAGDLHSTRSSLRVGLEEVQRNFERYGLLDDRVRFLVGWFSETLAAAPIERLAVMRLDGDMYESTVDALTALYPKLSPGGYVLIDDYALEGCRAAVDDFRGRHGIDEPIVRVDWTGAYWQRRPGA